MEEVKPEETEVENTFINKLLGEMKDKFNKSGKIKAPNTSDDDSLSSRECSSNSSTDNLHEEDVSKGNSTDVADIDHIKIEIDDVSSNNCVPEQTEEELNHIKDEDTDDKDHFRKPSKSVKTKSKHAETNGDTVRKTLRAKVQILEENVVVKRSPRRRSRDYNESIIQSAIARKEKLYNESSRPQRLTRLLKPTPKILENLANAAALKLGKNKKDKFKAVEDHEYGSDSTSGSEYDDKKSKRTKYRHGKTSKLVKYSKDTDGDHVDQELDENGKNNKVEDKSQRRSTRLSSRELPEANIPEQDDCFPADPECSTMKAQLIVSQLCSCTVKTQLFAATGDDEIVFCTAMDSVDEKIVGCSNIVNPSEVSLSRPSNRVPFTILCEIHLQRMLRHNCCPKCGLFCTKGQFVQCEAKHQYHRECQVSNGKSECCPHCGLQSPTGNILINMHLQGKPVFLPLQRPLYPAAKMSFSNGALDHQHDYHLPTIPAELINVSIKRENCKQYTINDLYETVKDGNLKKLVEMLGSIDGSISSPIEELEGGTLLHYAAQQGLSSTVHLLVISGAELNVLDKEQNTALITAIIGFENSIVSYLIKAGSSITMKGTDGMTPLHIAAKLGNLGACELLVHSSMGIKGYINVQDDGGWTPLVWACEHGHLEAAKFLVNSGADVCIRDVEHNTALHWAAFSGSDEIAQLLLNNNSDINALNVHGDTPLHIGARQDMYNFILILLSRGAQVDLINKAGETALDCCEPIGECHIAISLNVNLYVAKSSNNSKLVKTIVTNDISRGREPNPIQCVNVLDDEQLEFDFSYVVQNCVTSDGVRVDQKINSMHHCTCETKCLTLGCICCNSSLQAWYNTERKLITNFNYLDPPLIFECNQLCSCNAITCNNRIVQHGTTQRFQVFKTESKGWGVKTLHDVPKGTFVCEYIGEMIQDVEAERRDDDSYMFDLDNKEQDSFCIDAKNFGNFARFINHACEPNLVPIRVFIDHQDLRFPRIALFANKNISSDEELSFDYGEKFWLIKYKSFTCNCGCSNCKYSEDNIAGTIEKYNKKLEEEMAT